MDAPRPSGDLDSGSAAHAVAGGICRSVAARGKPRPAVASVALRETRVGTIEHRNLSHRPATVETHGRCFIGRPPNRYPSRRESISHSRFGDLACRGRCFRVVCAHALSGQGSESDGTTADGTENTLL